MALQVNTSFLLNASNNSDNIRDDLCSSPLEKEGVKVFLLFFYIMVMLLAILGNTSIIYIVYSNRTMRTSTNIFIANMAVCDLGIPYVLIPKKIARLFVGRYIWMVPGEFGIAVCKLVPFVHDVFVDCSTYSLLLITFDRFCAVLLPHKRHLLSNKVVVILITSAWLASISINAVLLRIYNVSYKDGRRFCFASWYSDTASDVYFKTLMCTNIIAPILLITSAYSAIFHKLKRQVQVLGNSISDQLKLKESLLQKKIVKMTFAIVCTFGICWLPIIFTVLFQPFVKLNANSTRYSCWVYRYSEFSLHMKVLPSITNPSLCFVFSKKYRDEFRRIFRGRFSCASNEVGNLEDEVNANAQR
ncbi:QRFP-like peptide receptor [Actinia tenebrosa]|uniref:QRFP-like peptide receptor n=1 Tax=Actinia tenebrosa TaxID=6105 RepID=A0A6P8HQR6_ACTTE|nr:QRFP-like peptide receptor [Actinia tenebrosa]